MFVYERTEDNIRLLAKIPQIQARSKLHDCVLAKLNDLGEKYCFKADPKQEDLYHILEEIEEVHQGILYNSTDTKLVKRYTFGLTTLDKSIPKISSPIPSKDPKKDFLDELKEQIAKMNEQPLLVPSVSLKQF